MWEELEIYKKLDKAEINPTFKKLGTTLLSLTNGFKLDQTSSIIKLSREVNHLEQAIFIEKDKGTNNLNVKTSLKPVDFYRKHKYTMVNIVPLGDILNNYRRTFYPLTQEWNELAVYLATRIQTEINKYFETYGTYEKIITRRKEVEPKDFGLHNKYELLIYASIRTKNQALLIQYLDKKMSNPAARISLNEYLKPENNEMDEMAFLQNIKTLALTGDFQSIEKEIANIGLAI